MQRSFVFSSKSLVFDVTYLQLFLLQTVIIKLNNEGILFRPGNRKDSKVETKKKETRKNNRYPSKYFDGKTQTPSLSKVTDHALLNKVSEGNLKEADIFMFPTPPPTSSFTTHDLDRSNHPLHAAAYYYSPEYFNRYKGDKTDTAPVPHDLETTKRRRQASEYFPFPYKIKNKHQKCDETNMKGNL